MTIAPLWSWPAALVLLLLGLSAGWLLLPMLWPMRARMGMRAPVGTFGLLALTVPSLFFLFLSVLRTAEGLVMPTTTWLQWLVFGCGLCLGLWLEERRQQ